MRADAKRNHERVLRAAHRLLLEADDPTAVTMDQVATAAGVGKGTLFRRFGDRVGLLRAIHAEQSTAHFDRLEERLSREEDAVERAVLVVRAVLRYKLDNRAVSLALESAGAGSPYDHAGYGAWHALLEQQATALGRRHAAYLAHALLAATRSDLVEHLSGVSDRTLLAGATTLVRSALRPPEPDPPSADEDM